MVKRITSPFSVDLKRDWRAFAQPSDSIEILGVVKRGEWDIGAFARDRTSQRYVCVNGANVYELDQNAAAAALRQAQGQS